LFNGLDGNAARKLAGRAFLAKTQAILAHGALLAPGCSEQAGEENEAIAVSKKTPPKKRWGWTPSGSPCAKRRQRLLDGLAGLAQRLAGLANWLAGPDPGFNRLRTVLCATLTIAAAIGAEWLFARLDQSAGPNTEP
jgi:hypothetical protein